MKMKYHVKDETSKHQTSQYSSSEYVFNIDSFYIADIM